MAEFLRIDLPDGRYIHAERDGDGLRIRTHPGKLVVVPEAGNVVVVMASTRVTLANEHLLTTDAEVWARLSKAEASRG
jgi:hypothetical protein